MLYLVRHGQTTWNASGLLLGRADPPLTSVGEAQAGAVAAWLGAMLAPGARVVSSPLVRARATASALGLPVEVDERWVEVDYGSYDGMPLADVPASVWAEWRADAGFTPPGGESLAAVGTRVRQACASLQADAAEGDVVVVSHVSPIKAAVAWAVDAPDTSSFRMHLDVAAVCRIAITPDGRPVLRTFNETAPPP
ncbi:MAG TPA: histidine phosphatase family protein [Acidimicrobiales bacterium]|nr:histidine phosphatase family protein [Acidimicrobiales bacterium]